MDAQDSPLELRLRRAVEAGELGLWDLRLDLETVHHSPQWKLRFGFPEPQSADSTHFWRCRVHPDDLEGMLTAMRAHLRGGQPCYEAVFRLRSNGSGYRLVHSRGRLIERAADARPVRMVGTMLDLTARPCTPGGGLAHGSPVTPAAVPVGRPFHELVCAGSDAAWVVAERRRVARLVEGLLDASLAALDGPNLP